MATVSGDGGVWSAASDTDALLREAEQPSNEAPHPTSDRRHWRSAVRPLRLWWRTLVVVLTPLVFLPIPLAIGDRASRAAYVIAIIAVYWVTEAVPLAVAALLPLVLFPALGVLTAQETALTYLNDANLLFLGGLMVAVAVEKWNLHKRIALLVLLVMGSKPRWLLLGFMATTAFLSMWISNTATAAMMLPIAHAVLEEIQGDKKEEEREEREEDKGGGEEGQLELSTRKTSEEEEGDGVESPKTLGTERQPAHTEAMDGTFRRLSKVLILGVAYSANIGGTGTLTGTGPNLVLSGDVSSLFPDSPGVNFGLWFAFAFPAMALALLCSWLYLSLLYCDDSFQWLKRRLGCRTIGHSFHSGRAKRVIREQYKNLGSIRYAEVEVLVLFVLLALLWLFREPNFMPGWGGLFPTDSSGKSYVSDSSVAVFIVFILFVLPSRPPFSCRRHPGCKWTCSCLEAGSSPRLLDWETVQSKLPWNVIILLGSGFALAKGAERSCLSAWIGSRLLGLRTLPHAVIAMMVSVIVACVTEVISNIATTTLFLPILAHLAVDLHINPLYLMVPAAFSASFAFMLPVATPPNAIAFSYGYIRVVDMVLTGIFMNILCVLIVSLALNTTGILIFGASSFPDWANTSLLATDTDHCSHLVLNTSALH